MVTSRPVLLARDPDASPSGEEVGAGRVARRLLPAFGDFLTVEVAETDRPEKAILERAREVDAGLIVVPAGRCRWGGRWEPLDDPGRRLARQSDRPVLLVPDEAGWCSPAIFGVATDFSARSRGVTRWTLDLARALDAGLRLFHAPEPPEPATDAPPYLTRVWLRSAVHERAAHHLEQLAREIAEEEGVSVGTTVADAAEPAAAVAEAASRSGLCLLSVGSLGLQPAGDRLLGPTAEGILSRYPGTAAVVPASWLSIHGAGAADARSDDREPSGAEPDPPLAAETRGS